MDSEQRNPNNENNPAQNELDFGANERVTPKRVIQPEPSALDKLRGLFAKKENKESLENKFSERKEPVFASSQTQENPTLENSTLTQSAVENTEIFTSTEPEKLNTNETTNSQEPAVEPVVEKAETAQPAATLKTSPRRNLWKRYGKKKECSCNRDWEIIFPISALQAFLVNTILPLPGAT